MYIEASEPRKPHDVAIIETYPMPIAEYCIQWKFYFLGVMYYTERKCGSI